MSLDLGRSTKILFDMYFSLKSACTFHYIHPLSPMITELDLSCCELFSKFKGFTERGANFLSLYDLNKSARHGPDNLKNRNIETFALFSQPQYGQPSISDRVGDLLQSEIRSFNNGEPTERSSFFLFGYQNSVRK